MNERSLRKVFTINAVFSGLSGALLLADAVPLARFMGGFPAWINELVGAGLLLFALDVFWIATRPRLSAALSRVIFYADLAWVAATPVVMLIFAQHLSFWGQMLLLDVGIGVALLAFFEGRGLSYKLAS